MKKVDNRKISSDNTSRIELTVSVLQFILVDMS